MEIKTAIIPAAGLGTRFLPLTKVLPKELLPLVDAPLIDYIAEEAKNSEISRIVFVLSENKKSALDYFKKNQRLEGVLEKDSRRKECLEAIKKLDQKFE